MKKVNPYAIFGGVVILLFGYYLYKKNKSRKAIEKVKDDELATNAPTQIEVPKMYIKAGVNVPSGAMSFVENTLNTFR